MMHPKNLSINDFTYPLPVDRIASYPLSVRDSSKLLIYNDGHISEDIYRNISVHIPAESLLIFNDTKVIEARLYFQSISNKKIELFCLSPDESYLDIASALAEQNCVLWYCLIGGASKWDKEVDLKKIIQFGGSEFTLSAKYIDRINDYYLIQFSWAQPGISFVEVLHYAGVVPLPPYIKRNADSSDSERYQTIYATKEGSVASPTAGLHFTQNVFTELEKKKITCDFVTLHVGAGTFKPVKSEIMEGHEMHAEFFSVSKDLIENIYSNLNKCIIAVGTTSLRTIESLYWLGVKIKLGIDIEPSLFLGQWEAYDLSKHQISTKNAISSLLSWMSDKNIKYLFGNTQIIIAPGYEFKILRALVTNFHQPHSTLILLVAAAIGDEWKKVYDYALSNNFRFLSYGDGSLLWIKH